MSFSSRLRPNWTSISSSSSIAFMACLRNGGMVMLSPVLTSMTFPSRARSPLPLMIVHTSERSAWQWQPIDLPSLTSRWLVNELMPSALSEQEILLTSPQERTSYMGPCPRFSTIFLRLDVLVAEVTRIPSYEEAT